MTPPKGQVDVSIDVTNIGDRDGKETVILYLNDEFGSVSRPVREVKGFKKVSLKAKETQTVQFTLKNEDFSFINRENKRVVEGGAFHVYFNNFDGNATFTVRVMAREANSNMISNIFLLFSLISTFLFN